MSTQAGNLVKSVDSLHFINGEYLIEENKKA